ncbi:Zonular occludens toxin [Burkholderia sp. Ac-20345]|uniref:zonular occludens toxin domain-containing protein n=1 Tax=Burkholderia sp. Ac-20345 TaxID=2703891 RepID=UPI00197C7B7B|nr:zonular occludens toxin domain-containing protein [Burkholderia sp. Ac-20345]MBN3784577.1 Zonular occludens toxin [Burkholderia sp. Ac-20345]
MPINAFGGGPGSGKTYGVMEHVILPAVAKGRFIITNIDGLDHEAIYVYVAENAPKGKIVCIGHIRSCDRSAPEEEDFFPGEEALDKPLPVPDAGYGRVWPGDLVVVDEATRYWSQGDKVKRGHAYFFREHRHFTNEMGHSCDLVVIDPDLTMLARALKGKVELSSVTHKPKAIGLNRYSVNLYRGVKLTGKPQSSGGPFAFKKEIYSLYKSYSHAQAKEQPIDRRQNLLLNKGMWAYAGAVLLLFGGGVFFAYRFFTHKAKPVEGQAAGLSAVVPGGGAVGSVGASGVPAPAASVKPPEFSDSWRVMGRFESGGLQYVVLADEAGRMRVDSPSAYTGLGAAVSGRVDGQRVTMWSGKSSTGPAALVSGGKSK